ncbi:MAG: hypothetical protein DRQ48_09955 [Gammaproteobacteria bacterium]|nr:MAG: hypothetical protein DRQ58_07635 [Gammaproteobacteria bacterium]RKZ67250.1 MAG: hypothetical protein DRQ48_09955 [Gammaproteobacteria bacterium]
MVNEPAKAPIIAKITAVGTVTMKPRKPYRKKTPDALILGPALLQEKPKAKSNKEQEVIIAKLKPINNIGEIAMQTI